MLYFLECFRFILNPILLLGNDSIFYLALFLYYLILQWILIFALRWISQLILLIPIKKDFLILNKFILLFILKCNNLILLIELVVLVINFIRIRRFRWKFLQTMIIVRFQSLWVSFKLKIQIRFLIWFLDNRVFLIKKKRFMNIRNLIQWVFILF